MKAKTVVEKFGFYEEKEPESIYPFSPVYRITNAEQDLVIKKTQHPILNAARLMEYTADLKNQRVKVVVPVTLPVENPMSINEDTFVAYPFIEGDTYKGEDWEIKEAGRMLGKIHSFSPSTNKFKLSVYNVFDFNEAEVKESVCLLSRRIKKQRVAACCHSS